MLKPYFQTVLILIFAVFLGSCQQPETNSRTGEPVYTTTIAPVGMILSELTEGRASVEVLLSPGASPHTYSPRPSDLSKANRSLGFFYVSESLDGWAGRFEHPEAIPLLSMVHPSQRLSWEDEHYHSHGDHESGHDHSHHHDHDDHDHLEDIDPHFWLDPLVVDGLLDPLKEKLCKLDPEGCSIYEANADRFSKELRALHESVKSELADAGDLEVIVFHPSFGYLFNRHGVELVAVVETTPGEEISGNDLQKLVNLIKTHELKFIFSEPQFSEKTVGVLAEESGVEVKMLDPIGGTEGRDDYESLIRFNVQSLKEAIH